MITDPQVAQIRREMIEAFEKFNAKLDAILATQQPFDGLAIPPGDADGFRIVSAARDSLGGDQ